MDLTVLCELEDVRGSVVLWMCSGEARGAPWRSAAIRKGAKVVWLQQGIIHGRLGEATRGGLHCGDGWRGCWWSIGGGAGVGVR